MLYNRCTGICKFGNNTYPGRIRCRSNLGHIFTGKNASYGPGNAVLFTAFNKLCIVTITDLSYEDGAVSFICI